MYRPPEMCDQYLKFDVNLQADIWMLGCILFILCFAHHPFQDGSTLAISSAKYEMPSAEEYPHLSVNLRKLIQVML